MPLGGGEAGVVFGGHEIIELDLERPRQPYSEAEEPNLVRDAHHVCLKGATASFRRGEDLSALARLNPFAMSQKTHRAAVVRDKAGRYHYTGARVR